jgi:hypothetical protein
MAFGVSQAKAVVALDEGGEGVELLDFRPMAKQGGRGMEEEFHSFPCRVIKGPHNTPQSDMVQFVGWVTEPPWPG